MKQENNWFASLIVRSRYLLLLIALTIVIVVIALGKPMIFDRSIESMFRADDKLLIDFQKLKRVFESNEILMVAYSDDQLMNPDRSGIERLERFGNRLKAVSGIKEVMSLAEIDRMLSGRGKQDAGANNPYSGITDPDNPLAQRFSRLFAGYTHSEDGKIAVVVCILEPIKTDATAGEKVIERIRKEIDSVGQEEASIESAMLIGEPVMIADSFRMIEQDGLRLRWSSSILLVIIIFLIFRSVRWMLIPVAVVQFALLLTQAILAWSNLRLTMVSSMMDAIITVIGVATTVHIIVRYRQARRTGDSREQSVQFAFAFLIAPIFWAIATDTAGFMALYFSQLGPVRDFAIMMALGSTMVLVSTIMIVPALSLIPLPPRLRFLDNDPAGKREQTMLDAHLQRPLSWARQYPLLMISLIILFSGLVSWGIRYSEVESDFTRNFRRNSEIVQSYEYVEDNLGGAGAWDVMIPAPKVINYEYLKRIKKLENRLRTEVVIERNGRSEPGLSKVISLADAVYNIVPVNLDSLPFGQDAFVRTSVSEMRMAMPSYFAAIYSTDPDNPDQFYLRIMLRSKERRSTEEKKTIIKKVESICLEELADFKHQTKLSADLTNAKNIDSGNRKIEKVESISSDQITNDQIVTTGYYVLIANMIDSVIRDQWVTFGIAIGCIFVMLVIATRSIRYALISMVPNVVPILMVLGIMGWLGEKVNIGVAMIAAVSIGMSVDSSIHYIISFKRAMLAGDDLKTALDSVQNRVGRALVLSTLAIILGFATLCQSNFIPIVYFGVLSIMAMIGGLMGNLIVLPLLLQLFAPRQPKANAVENSAGRV